jgi:hypothetical protein
VLHFNILAALSRQGGATPTASLVTAAQVEKDCPTEVQDLGRRLAAHYDKLTKCEDKAEQHKIAIGQLLVRAKEVCDAGGFAAFRERFCPQLGKSRAYELLQIASGKKTSEETKAATRDRVREHRASKKLPKPAPEPEPEPEPELLSVTVTESAEVGANAPGDTPEQQWQYSLGNMAGESISLWAFWDKTFGKEWREFDVSSVSVTLAQQAADAWARIADELTTRAGATPLTSNGEAPIAGSDCSIPDDLSVPHCLRRDGGAAS